MSIAYLSNHNVKQDLQVFVFFIFDFMQHKSDVLLIAKEVCTKRHRQCIAAIERRISYKYDRVN
jgi:hypothetical protein